jgi:hypothetical protein
MIALSLVVLAQAAFAPTPAASYDGQCIYPPGLGEPRGEEVRVTCNRVATDSGGVEFHDRNWDARMLRFSGEWAGDRLTVRSVTPRRGSTVEARGLCRIYHANEAVSVIACTAVSGSRSWIGNFRVSRL